MTTKKTEKTELEKRLEAEIAAAAAQEQEPAVPAAPEGVTEVTPSPASTPSAEEQLATVTAERDNLKDQFLRTLADFDNYRKRTTRDMERVRKTAAEDLVRDLLPVLDNLERALAHAADVTDGFAQGVQMVHKQLCEALAARGLEPIPALGETFDPNVHEALAQQPSEEFPANTVMAEWQRGYRMGALVLRPSRVVVSSGPLQDEGVVSTTEPQEEGSKT